MYNATDTCGCERSQSGRTGNRLAGHRVESRELRPGPQVARFAGWEQGAQRGRPRNAARASAIADAYTRGVKLEAIGAEFGISRQRVLQIAKREGLSLRDPSKGRRMLDRAS